MASVGWRCNHFWLQSPFYNVGFPSLCPVPQDWPHGLCLWLLSLTTLWDSSWLGHSCLVHVVLAQFLAPSRCFINAAWIHGGNEWMKWIGMILRKGPLCTREFVPPGLGVLMGGVPPPRVVHRSGVSEASAAEGFRQDARPSCPPSRPVWGATSGHLGQLLQHPSDECPQVLAHLASGSLGCHRPRTALSPHLTQWGESDSNSTISMQADGSRHREVICHLADWMRVSREPRGLAHVDEMPTELRGGCRARVPKSVAAAVSSEQRLRFHLVAGSHCGDLRRAPQQLWPWAEPLSVSNLSVYPSMEIASCQVANSEEMEAVLSPPANVTAATLAHPSTWLTTLNAGPAGRQEGWSSVPWGLRASPGSLPWSVHCCPPGPIPTSLVYPLPFKSESVVTRLKTKELRNCTWLHFCSGWRS